MRSGPLHATHRRAAGLREFQVRRSCRVAENTVR